MGDSDRQKWDRRYREGAYAERTHPSALLAEQIAGIPAGRALDVACGAGRNALFLAARGFEVDAVDISGEGLALGRDRARKSGLSVNWIQHDLDSPLDGPEPGYQLILVVRYVNLPLLPRLVDLLAPGGYLLCEEHLESDAEVIGPGNPAFRVRPGDLEKAAAGLDICQLQEGLVTEPDGRLAALAQLVARKPAR